MLNGISRRGAAYIRQSMARLLPDMGEQVMQLASYFPHSSGSYSLPAYAQPASRQSVDPLPVPPRDPLWANYCTTVESFLQSGQDDTDTMRRLLHESGAPIEQAGTILEWGVAGGRLIRHLADLTPTTEVWGVDLWSSAIYWCQEHLSPPFHFATTTAIPHLPFEDRTFGLIYAGSVFTHLDDLVSAWALELRRVLKPGGRLYFSLNDRHAARIFEGEGTPENRARYIERVRLEGWTSWLELIHDNPHYRRFLQGDAQMVTMCRPAIAHVLWDVEYLKTRFGPGWRWHSVTPEAYGHQTCALLERI